MKRELWIWVTRWQDFQHYAPERDRAPAWIKDYTRQMADARYLQLTDRQRALLVDLRRIHAVTTMRTPYEPAVISRHRHMRTRYDDMEALRRAGFIEVVTRKTLEQRLELFYSSPRARVEVEGDREKEKATATKPTRGKRTKATSYERAVAFTRNAGHALEPVDFLAELQGYELTPDQRHDLERLRETLLNGVKT